MPNMNDEYLDYTGLAYYDGRLKTLLATKDELQTLADEVDDIIAEGGEPNVIEVVKVNNSALTPDANKAVNIDLSGYAETSDIPTDLSDLTNIGQDPYAKESDIPTKLSELTNDGDGTQGSAFATEDYVDQNGGKIQKIKVNGTEQTISQQDKSVDITVPTDLSDLTNTGQDPYATMSDVESAQVGALKPKGSVAFANLPQLTAANLNNMYNVTDAFTTTADFVEGAGKSYPAGTNVAIINTGTDQNPVYKYDAYTGVIDMSGYWSTSDLVAITTAQIDALFE